eukprot:scaffold57706_cov82-Phaeocystis_antarctica.AAC.11
MWGLHTGQTTRAGRERAVRARAVLPVVGSRRTSPSGPSPSHRTSAPLGTAPSRRARRHGS